MPHYLWTVSFVNRDRRFPGLASRVSRARFPWMRVLAQAGRILLVGLCLGVAAGVVRGFPEIAEAAGAEGACLPPVTDEPAARWVDLEEAAELHDSPSVAFVDAREHDEFVAGHVSGALSAPMATGVIDEELVEVLRGSTTVVVYDDTHEECAHSTRLAALLASSGISDVRVMQGGMPSWLEAGYPAEAGTCRLCP